MKACSLNQPLLLIVSLVFMSLFVPTTGLPTPDSLSPQNNNSSSCRNETQVSGAQFQSPSPVIRGYSDVFADHKTYVIMGGTVVVTIVAWILRKKRIEQKLLSSVFISPEVMKSTNSSNSGDRSLPQTARVRTFKGKNVFLKSVMVSHSGPLSKRTKKFLCQLFELRHENLCIFFGVLHSSDSLAPEQTLVWEHCVHGSLADVLEDPDVHMDWNFRLSLLMDVVRGMRYLHSSDIKFHGCLKSTNCLIDGRWIVKIADMGMMRLRRLIGMKTRNKRLQNFLYVAPEHLRDGLRRAMMTGSQAGDVYSFAIVSAEVLSRKSVEKLMGGGSELEKTIERIRHLVGDPYRPTIEKPDDVPDAAVRLIQRCWSEQPIGRPTFRTIFQTMKKYVERGSENIVENMFHKLELYSSSLEEMVKERTTLLEVERKKVDTLLSRILPPIVIERLKQGLEVLPEQFDEATVYFCDIVGFTSISAQSTPLQIVELLNQLYTAFDDRIAEHRVYKVETIGDAYMVVAGVPERDPRHAEYIALMALDLLHTCSTIRIPHAPHLPLILRTGINTGPVVAGVVGHRMPRYCLFGDTVNIASRMESTSCAYRIQISGSTRDKLLQAGDEFQMEYRAEVHMKGKGQQSTYWLTGCRSFHKSLPSPIPDE